MKKLIAGSVLCVLGIILYVCYKYFAGGSSSHFGMFSDGVLFGLAIGILLIGITFVIIGLVNIYKIKKNKTKE